MTHLIPQILGDQVLRVLDIGARGRLAPRFAPMSARVEIIGFEPNAAECDRLNVSLRRSDWRDARVLPYAVGRTAADRPFFVTEAPELSSLLEPLAEAVGRPGWRVNKIERVDTVSLDDLAASGELPQPIDFIKVDTQGSELEILRSGEGRVIDGLLGIAAEVEFRELYRDQPLFSEIESCLRGHGFELVLLEPAHLRTDWPFARKRTSYADALFLRGRDWLATPRPEDAQRRLLALYLLHGLYAEAQGQAAALGPAVAAAVAAEYGALGRGDFRWRLRLMMESLRCAASPTIANRHRLTRLSRIALTPDGRSWPVDPP